MFPAATDARREPLPGWWTAVASLAAAAAAFAVVFTIGILQSRDPQAGWGFLLTAPVAVASFPVVAIFVVHALVRRDRPARRRPFQIVATAAAAAMLLTSAEVIWSLHEEERRIEVELATGPARDYERRVDSAYREAADRHGLEGWDHVPAKEQWLLDLDGDGRVDADAAPVVALPDDGTVRIYDTDGDLVIDAVETTDEYHGTWCTPVRWEDRVQAFIEAYHEAREGPCPAPDDALVQ